MQHLAHFLATGEQPVLTGDQRTRMEAEQRLDREAKAFGYRFFAGRGYCHDPIGPLLKTEWARNLRQSFEGLAAIPA